MAVKIRLQRHGKKNFAFELLGSYNPNTNPATIVLDGEKALAWLKVGAQPTLVTRRILSYEGVLLRKHLAEGVAKGALTEAEADAKFAAWKAQRDEKIAAKKTGLKNEAIAKAQAAKKAEQEVNEARAKAIAAKKAEAEEAARKAAEEASAEAQEAEPVEAPAE